MLTDTTLFTEIDKEEVTTIFSNIESIYHRHAAFLDQIEVVFKNWNEESLLSPLFEEIVRLLVAVLADSVDSLDTHVSAICQ